jgi:hypothetical protein
VRASTLSVLQRRVGAAAHRARVGEYHPPDIRLDDSRDRERIAGRLERDLVVGAEALREQLQRLGIRPHPRRGSDRAALSDRDLAEVAMNIQRDETHLAPPFDDERTRGGQ